MLNFQALNICLLMWVDQVGTGSFGQSTRSSSSRDNNRWNRQSGRDGHLMFEEYILVIERSTWWLIASGRVSMTLSDSVWLHKISTFHCRIFRSVSMWHGCTAVKQAGQMPRLGTSVCTGWYTLLQNPLGSLHDSSIWFIPHCMSMWYVHS